MEEHSTWTLDHEIRVPGIVAQMRTYHWPRAFESIEATAGPTAMLTLSNRPPVTSGRFCASSGPGRFVAIGGVTFAPAQIPMHWRTEGGLLRLLRCELDRDRFRSLAALDERWTGAELEASLDIRSGELSRILSGLATELMAPGFAAPVLIEALGVELTVGLSRYFRHVRADDAADARLSAALPLGRLADYIDGLSGPAPALGALAQLCGVSRGHLMRAFKARTGLTIHAYVQRIRFRRAQALLADTQLPLKEIAFRLGFSNPAHFSAAFRKLGGEAPMTFRRRSRRV